MEAIPIQVFQEASAITARLVKMLFIEQVYLNRMERQDKEKWELIVLIAQNNQQHIIESVPLIRTVLALHPDFGHRTFYIGDVKTGLKFGNMVFFCLCQPDRLVYINPCCSITLLTRKSTFKRTYNKAQAEIEKEQIKIESFRKGVWFYLAMENYPFCALMLHQLFECCYRFAELALLGKEKISHSLKNHHRDLLPYVPDLNELFNQSNPREMDLVHLLDEAYLAVRYQNSYTIRKEELLLLIERSVRLEDLVTERARQFMCKFRERFSSPGETLSEVS